MSLSEIIQWAAFTGFASMAIAGALGMATTMSMFRSGIFLMASFVGVAGLFILLSADLLSLLQVMMYIGGMLVMILFMVLFSHDPGGSMMAGMMELPPIERFFSLGLAGGDHHGNGEEGMEHDSSEDNRGEENGGRKRSGGHDGGEMDMSQMSMSTPLKPYAAALAGLVGLSLAALLLLRPTWPVSVAQPDPYSAREVGSLLMGKYMIAFEGAGLLILIGIFGAVLVSRPGRFPDSGKRGARVAADAPPAQIDGDYPEPLAASGNDNNTGAILEAHEDDRDKGRSG